MPRRRAGWLAPSILCLGAVALLHAGLAPLEAPPHLRQPGAAGAGEAGSCPPDRPREEAVAEAACAAGTHGFGRIPFPVIVLGALLTIFLWERFAVRTFHRGPSSIARQIAHGVQVCKRRRVKARLSTTGAHSGAGPVETLHSRMMSFYARTEGAKPACLPRTCSASSGRLGVHEGSRGAGGSQRFDLVSRGSVALFARHTTSVRDAGVCAEIVMFRVGHLDQELTIRWRTVDGTAVAGDDYVGTPKEGLEATFQRGSDTLSLSVEVLPNPYFTTEKFFVVHAEVASGCGAVGGVPFSSVRILNTCLWPKGFRQQTEEEKGLAREMLARMPRRYLFMGFVFMMVKLRGDRYYRTVLGNLWLDFERVVLSTLLLNYALYDFCLTRADDPEAYSRAPIVVLAKFALILANRYADQSVKMLAGNNAGVSYLQRQLVHKYLEMGQDEVPASKFYHLFFEIVPECIAHAFKPTYDVIKSLTVLVMSLSMAVVLPSLKGSHVAWSVLRPLMHLFLFVPFVFYIVAVRRSKLAELTRRRCAAHNELCSVLGDLMQCRHWVRSFDGAFPCQQVRFAFDGVSVDRWLSGMDTCGIFQLETQWVAMYFGEGFRLIAVLYGSYAVLSHARTGGESMTLGEFAVFLSLYSAVISAVYTIIEAFGSFLYASVLLRELAEYFNKANPRLEALRMAEQEQAASEEPLWREPTLAIRIGFVRADRSPQSFLNTRPLEASPCDVEMEFGGVYALRVHTGCDGTRRWMAALLGGMASAKRCAGVGFPSVRVVVPSFARTLLVAPALTLGAGAILENLMATAADWVRPPDALAVATVLGIPFESPEDCDLEYLRVLDSRALVRALAKGARRAQLPLSRSRANSKDSMSMSMSVQPSMRREASQASMASQSRYLRLPAFRDLDLEFLQQVTSEFSARMDAGNISAHSPTSEVLPLLRPPEALLLDLARGLLADPDVLVAQDTLAGLPQNHGMAVLRVLGAWQRLGGLRGLVGVWEDAARRKVASSRDDPFVFAVGRAENLGLEDTFPPWLPWMTPYGGICRTVVLSESSLVATGLNLDSHIDAWLETSEDTVQVVKPGMSWCQADCLQRCRKQPWCRESTPPYELEDETEEDSD